MALRSFARRLFRRADVFVSVRGLSRAQFGGDESPFQKSGIALMSALFLFVSAFFAALTGCSLGEASPDGAPGESTGSVVGLRDGGEGGEGGGDRGSDRAAVDVSDSGGGGSASGALAGSVDRAIGVGLRVHNLNKDRSASPSPPSRQISAPTPSAPPSATPATSATPAINASAGVAGQPGSPEPPGASDPSALPNLPELTDDEIRSLDNERIGWGVKLAGTERPVIPQRQSETLDRFGAAALGRDEPVIYLTFDEGYENGCTESILDTLAETETPAAFFVTGHYIASAPDLVRRMLDEGHLVCNHTLSHKYLPDLTSSEIEEEVEGLAGEFRERFGTELARFVRPPGGVYGERCLATLARLGWRCALWSFAWEDYDAENSRGEDYAYEKITENLHNGEVMLLHAVSEDNALALKRVIETARASGFEFRRLDAYSSSGFRQTCEPR